MKLVDILARELKVWPDSASHAVQDNYAHYKGDIFLLEGLQINTDRHDFADGWHLGPGVLVVKSLRAAELAEDHTTAIITREQWQAAVDALKLESWTGEGLPPVGTVCEVTTNDGHNWHPWKVLFADEYVILVGSAEGKANYKLLRRCDADVAFRPIRTAEYIEAYERELALTDMCVLLGKDPSRPGVREMAGVLFDAGYRKQVSQ